jgi:hypothetical protein
VLVPVPPRGPAARRRRRAWAVAGAAGALALVAAGAAGAAFVLDRHPGAPARLRALVAGGARRAAALGDGGAGVSQPPRPGRLACVPAVTVGRPGELRPLPALGAPDRATALWQWPRGAGSAGRERQALRDLAGARALAVVPVGRGGALAVTADGATPRALAARAPGATAQLAAAGTRELCVLD